MIALKGILEKDTALQVGFVLFYPILKAERTWSYLSLFTALVPPPFPPTAIFPVGLLVSHYLNNRVFLSRNYRLIVAPRRERRSFEGKYASFKNIKFPRGNYQTDSSETNTLFSLLFTTKFSRSGMPQNWKRQEFIYQNFQPLSSV